MAMNLMEVYSKRLALADKLHVKSHQGQHLTESKKVLIAKCLENTQKFIKESYEGGTQVSDMGLFTKFSLNLINVALPTLIATDIVMTYPMSSMSGYINYLAFSYGKEKGNTLAGTRVNDPFALGDVDVNYTSSKVSKDYDLTEATTEFTAQWKPLIAGTVSITQADGTKFVDDGKGSLVEIPEGGSVSRRTVRVEPTEEYGDVRFEGVEPTVETVVYGDDGSVVIDTVGTVDYEAGTITITNGVEGAVNVSYAYNNVIIPQNNLPILKAEMRMMPLTAKARRIAIYYSQMAAFQSKTDYGVDIGAQLAEKAVGQLSYEIDTEVTTLLEGAAKEEDDLVWSKTLPIGVSKADHYDGFSEIVELARMHIYDRTKRYSPNYMLISSSVLPVLTYCKGFTAATPSTVNGPYLAGTFNNIKVYVTPNMEQGKFVLGVNEGEASCSAAVYAPYMPIVPTQLLGFADGAMSQGFSTLYDLKILNRDLLCAGKVIA